MSDCKPSRVSSDFGAQEAFRKAPHTGIDYPMSKPVPVYVNQPMTVETIGSGGDAGNYVILRDASGNRHQYAHLSAVGPITQGQVIQPGTAIGNTGNTGFSTGLHLHYEVRKGPNWNQGTPINPNSIDPATGKPYTHSSGFNPGQPLGCASNAIESPIKPINLPPPKPIPQPTPAPPVPGQPPAPGEPGSQPPSQPGGSPGGVVGGITPAIDNFFNQFGHVMNPRLGAGDLRETRVPR